jgi:DNA sulfur modification protein DndC
MVNDGHPELAPLLKFRDWLMDIRDQPRLRYKKRRNGQPGPGPFQMSTRRKILVKLRKVEEATQLTLLSTDEEVAIRELWQRDEA